MTETIAPKIAGGFLFQKTIKTGEVADTILYTAKLKIYNNGATNIIYQEVW